MENYIVNINNNDYELPNYNIDIMSKIEKIETANVSPNKSTADKLKGMYEFIGDLLGTDVVKEEIGEFAQADPNAINIVYLKIVRTYNKPLKDYNTENINSEFADYDFGKVKEITELYEKVDNIATTTQGLNRKARRSLK